MADESFHMGGGDELAQAMHPHMAALIKAAQAIGENPAGFALCLPLHDDDPNVLAMYVAGGIFGEEQSQETTFRILAEGLAFLIEGAREELGPLLPELFERIVRATGGTVETVHAEAPDELPGEGEEPDTPLKRMARRRRG